VLNGGVKDSYTHSGPSLTHIVEIVFIFFLLVIYCGIDSGFFTAMSDWLSETGIQVSCDRNRFTGRGFPL
jgi:hypothetical protein